MRASERASGSEVNCSSLSARRIIVSAFSVDIIVTQLDYNAAVPPPFLRSLTAWYRAMSARSGGIIMGHAACHTGRHQFCPVNSLEPWQKWHGSFFHVFSRSIVSRFATDLIRLVPFHNLTRASERRCSGFGRETDRRISKRRSTRRGQPGGQLSPSLIGECIAGDPRSLSSSSSSSSSSLSSLLLSMQLGHAVYTHTHTYTQTKTDRHRHGWRVRIYTE